MVCPHCDSTNTKKNGTRESGSQRYKCNNCERHWSDSSDVIPANISGSTSSSWEEGNYKYHDRNYIEDITEEEIKGLNINATAVTENGKKQYYKADEFELGSGVNYSINELADMFGHKKTYIPERPGEYDKTLCDYSKAKKELDWVPKKDLMTYVEHWVEKNYEKI